MSVGQRWEGTKQILEDALRLKPGERKAFLDSACGSDAELRAEVESLIASYEQAGSQFLAAPAPEIVRLSLVESTLASKVIGPYRLVEEIGRGGMGQVWLAEQTAPVRRRVALKLIKAGMYDDDILKRFDLERQSLALMDHPSIAKVFDAGATHEGQPYFVMEYVPGVPITEYCDQKHLKIRERLELFIKVCEAVQHAHQKAILHRDLKPANILVQEVDGRAIPRVIDFGLAKATGPHVTGESLNTQIGAFVGTPGYMSPEQCGVTDLDVDTRSDVYSLGALLYVLLTGALPFQEKPGKEQPFDEMLRRVREEDPPRPSAKASADREQSSARAEARGTHSKQLVSLLRGDLDWITMKALEKDRSRRYGTASELAAEITRYLNHQPVLARPASVTYRLRKHVRRHRVGVAIGLGLVLMLIGFGIMQEVELRRITRERDRADRIAKFMTGVFRVSDPNERVGAKVTAEELLDKASKDINTDLAKDPDLQVRLMHDMGRAYLYLGLFDRAQPVFERAVKVGRPDDREVMLIEHDLAWTLLEEGRLKDAENLERRLLEKQTRVLGPDHLDTLATLSELAFTLCQEDNCSEGVKMSREVLEKQKRKMGPEAHYTLVTMDNLALMLSKDGHPDEAAKLQQESLDIHLRVFGPENLSTINAMTNLAEFERDMGKDEDAKKLLNQCLDIEHRVLGPDQVETAVTTYDLGTVLAKDGQKDEAFSLLRQAIDHGLPPLGDLQVENDPHLAPLHDDPRFPALVAYAKARAAALNPK